MIDRNRMLAALGALVMACGSALAHMSPFITVKCDFIDRDGKAASGLNALVVTEDGRGEGEIENGRAEIRLELSGSYRESVTLAIVDAWRKPIFILDSLGRRTDCLRFKFVEGGEPSDPSVPGFLKAFDRGALHLGPRGCRRRQDPRSAVLVLDWAPGDLTPAQSEESGQGSEIDRRNEEDLRRRIESIRRRGMSL